MLRRQFKWKPLLLFSASILAVGVILIRFVFPTWLPSAPQTPTTKPASIQATIPAGQTMPAIIPTIVALHPQPQPATPTALPAATTTAPTVSPAQGQRLVTFVNKMSETVWVAAASSAGHDLSASGWVLAPGASVSITIPDAWNGRFWGRTGCSFNSSGSGQCATGDCAGHFQCGESWGSIPATLGEFNLNSYAGLDFYDVSLVDGANLPMYINSIGGDKPDTINSNGCSAAGCTKNLLDTCPSELQIKNSGGQEIACTAACNVFHTDQYCCRGAYAARDMCDPTKWPVNYAKIFKAAEPFAYSYPDDDATSTLTCKPECGYRITFGVSP